MTKRALEPRVRHAVEQSIEVKRAFFDAYSPMVIDVAQMIAKALHDGHKLLIFGNGGSSTDASHIAAEFVGRFVRERPGLPAIALNTDMAILTAVGNDYGFNEIFSRQLKALGQAGDIAIALSTSGNSPNVLKAVEAAKRKKLKVVALTGGKGGKLAARAGHAFVVPSDVTARIQETHITLGHIICQLVEEILFDAPRKDK